MANERQIQICGKSVILGETARATGISICHLSRLVNGKRWPSFDTANKIATYIGVSLDDLYQDLKGRIEVNG